MMIPKIGMTVLYSLTDQDAEQINRRRTTGFSIAARIADKIWPIGAQAHIGNTVYQGEQYPALIVKTWGRTPESAVQLQVFLDGNDTYWATSRTHGPHNGQFSYMPQSL